MAPILGDIPKASRKLREVAPTSWFVFKDHAKNTHQLAICVMCRKGERYFYKMLSMGEIEIDLTELNGDERVLVLEKPKWIPIQ
jgi:hypothetical protein